MTLTLTATVLVKAQEPDLSRMYVHPPIQVANVPQNPSAPPGILPAQLKAAYGFNQVPNQGQGQTIALVDAYDDPNISSDLAFYQAYFHLGSCNFQKVIVGNPLQGQGWDLEESLDVEQACALASRANIILIEANSDSLSDMLAAVQVAIAAPYNASVVSMSWGYPEFSGEQNYDSYFCNISNANGPVTFVAASGDSGHAIFFPTVSRCVVSAGGTTLTLSTVAPLSNPLQLDYGRETAWDGSSGGISEYESGLSWQDGIFQGCGTNGMRCVPDISSLSNSNPGVPVYDTLGYGGWVLVGGTSVASPDWASFFTLVNSMRAAADPPKGTLSQAAQDLYAIYNSPNYLLDFHDITDGSNGNCGIDCVAGPGYDLVTGIGSYQANRLAPVLVADPN